MNVFKQIKQAEISTQQTLSLFTTWHHSLALRNIHYLIAFLSAMSISTKFCRKFIGITHVPLQVYS